MRKISIFALAALFVLSSCATKEDIARLDERIDGLSSSEISSLAEELGKVKQAIQSLQRADSDINGYIDELGRKQGALDDALGSLDSAVESLNSKYASVTTSITNLENRMTGSIASAKAELEKQIGQLREQDEQLRREISALKDYADSSFAATRDWAGDTFSTLEQYNATCATIDSIKLHMASTDSLYTALKAEFAASTRELKDSLGALRLDLEICLDRIDQCNDNIASAKQEITAAYTAAIATVQSALEALGARVTSCEENIAALQQDLASRIQSLTFVPQYSDGKAGWMYYRMANGDVSPDATNVFYYHVQPESLASVVASSPWNLKFVSVFTTTRADLPAPSLVKTSVKSASVVNGLLAVTVESSAVDVNVFKGNAHINFCLSVNDGKREISSSFVELVANRYELVKFGNDGFKEFCVSRYDSNHDGEISIAEATQVTSMAASGTAFSSANGIEMFDNLVSVNFSNNVNLKSLDLSRNLPMSNIVLTGCDALNNLKYDDSSCNVTCNFAPGRRLTVNGVNSVVCIVMASGARKISTAYEQVCSSWDASLGYYGATSMDDGLTNTNKIIAATNTCEPVNWARSLGERWYLPAVNELKALSSGYDTIFAGLPIEVGVYHDTSTESADNRSEFYIVNIRTGVATTLTKNWVYRSIAMKVL